MILLVLLALCLIITFLFIGSVVLTFLNYWFE